MKISVDLGYTYVKSVYGDEALDTDIFKSTLREDFIDVGGAIRVNYEGQKYTVGDDTGRFSSDLNKINDDVFKICLYTAIGRAIIDRKNRGFYDDYESIQLVTGLPVAYYSKQKQELRDSLMGKCISLVIDGKFVEFMIDECIVFPQGAGLFLLERMKEEVLVIDIGGMTIDVTHLKGDTLMSEPKTYDKGMIKVYAKIVQDINSREGLNFDLLKGEEILNDKRYWKDEGYVNYDPSKIVNAHLKDVINDIKMGFPYRATKKVWIGGGSVSLEEWIKDGEVKDNGLFANAKIFYEVAVQKFE